MKLKGNTFENGPTCKGVGFTDKNAALDLAVIEISGRYPEQGWTMNEIVHEMVYIQRGRGI